MDCRQVHARLTAMLHGELDPTETRQVEHHVASCNPCGRLLQFDRDFELRLRNVPAATAPARLRLRLQSELQTSTRSPFAAKRLVRPALWAASGALAAALVLLVALPRQPRSSPSVRVPAEITATVVCLGCVSRPETISLHAQRRGHDHVNGLRDGEGRLWHILDAPQRLEILSDDGLMGKHARVRGTLFPASQSIVLESLELVAGESAWRLKPIYRLHRRGHG
jgi:hypothetical protein